MMDTNVIIQARNADLLNYLASQGYKLIKSGSREYRLREHDSLVISNNRWHWFSQDIGGNTLDFLTKYEGKNFKESVSILSNVREPISAIHHSSIFIPKYNTRSITSNNGTPESLELPPKSTDSRKLFTYLCNSRKLDRDIIKKLIGEGKLYQSQQNNCVFVSYDTDGTPRFACERGTLSSYKFHRDCPCSDKSFCFHIDGRSNRVFTFESSIDAISHATLYKMSGKDYTLDHRISLGGLSYCGLVKFLECNPNVKEIVLCLDNDKQGILGTKRFVKMLQSSDYIIKVEPSKGKDYNDDLIEKARDKQMAKTK